MPQCSMLLASDNDGCATIWPRILGLGRQWHPHSAVLARLLKPESDASRGFGAMSDALETVQPSLIERR
jgi:hypothetical protein